MTPVSNYCEQLVEWEIKKNTMENTTMIHHLIPQYYLNITNNRWSPKLPIQHAVLQNSYCVSIARYIISQKPQYILYLLNTNY